MKTPPDQDAVQDRTKWSDVQTLDVLKMYLSPGGNTLDVGNEEVTLLASEQNRQPSSIALKLKNFRYLDPEAEAAGAKGMSGFSKNDVSCWKSHAGRRLSDRAVKTIQQKGWQDLLESGGSHNIIPNTPITRALLAKPFLILTGPSGTGKTREAIKFAESLTDRESRAVVAVGADWTDNRHVLGYLNPLETEDGGEARPIYETTPILELILHANESAEKPHVLILDEMNLSHVERYFADFLSAMELKDKTGALKLHAAGEAVTRSGQPVPGNIDFPANLFVIGTVNIDETTHMFSPKVLDRANVIEIHAGETALGEFLRRQEPPAGIAEARDYGIPFLAAAGVIQGDEDDPEVTEVPALPDTVRQEAADHLMALFRIMKRGRGEFGFRTGREVLAYLRTAHFLAGPGDAERLAWAADGKWHGSLDEQILQKILPKLHGSRSRLAPLLGALARYCAGGDEAAALEHFPKDGAAPKRTLQAARGVASPKFKTSYEKLERMIEVLVEEQFVSFIC